MVIFVDIDNTICSQQGEHYDQAEPWYDNIAKINKLYDEGHYIKYWSARGSGSGIDWQELTRKQLTDWNCRYHELSTGEKPFYDLLVCDKTIRIEEI